MASLDERLNTYTSILANNVNAFKRVVHELQEVLNGVSTVFITGVGKSGLVGKKCTATWQSIGLPCFFLDPVNAIHGDLGAVHLGDVILYLSNSGCSDELVRLAKHVKTISGITQVSLTNSADSPLSREMTDSVYLDIPLREADTLSLVPSVSTVIFMMILDVTGIEIAEGRGPLTEQFRRNHPSGALGNRIECDKSKYMDFSGIEIYYDGLALEKYADTPFVSGFTTNCTLFSKSDVRTYRTFYESKRDHLKGRPFSLQAWKDEPEALIAQIDEIHSIDPTIHVKIPIRNSRGEWNGVAIRYAVAKRIPLNLTAIHTRDEIQKAYEFLEGSTAPEIVSVFAGPISDMLIDPAPYVTLAVSLFRGKQNTKILWAGCREPYTIHRARELGCHIITIPDSVFEKLVQPTLTLDELTIKRVKTFYADATTGKIVIL